MTASAAEPRRRRVALLLAAGLAGLLAGACATRSAPPGEAVLEPLPSLPAYAPDAADRAARDAAAAALASEDARLERALADLRAIERERSGAQQTPTGLVPHVLDLRNAIAHDADARQQGTLALLERDDLDAALRTRLTAETRDDPLQLADARIGDARRLRFARIFNALAAPVGRSLLSGAMLPLRLVRALMGLAVAEHLDDELNVPERQALAHWKQFIEAHPDDPRAAALLAQVEESQRRWYRTQRDRRLRAARRALERGDEASTLLLTEQALHYAPEDRAASALRDEAGARLEQDRIDRARSLQVQATPELVDGGALAVALLARPDAIETEATRVLEAGRKGPLADEARFALALVRAEAGAERKGWHELEHVARDRQRNMSRHAWALLASPDANPHRQFRAARNAERSLRARWLAFGPLARGARDRDLPRALEWLIEVPALFEVVLGLPNRLIRYPWARPQSRAPEVFARRYLARHPDGERAPDVRRWLVAREASREQWIAAFAVAETDPDADAERLGELRERAARQALEVAQRSTRRDVQLALLREVSRDFPDTTAAREAAEATRRMLEEATPQRIRISRAFLREHPEVAGAEGLALRPGLLDEELGNGELHERGVTLLGGRVIELAFVNEEGDESGEPLTRRRKISQQRLARVVARLEEATLHLALTDPDYELEPDADRDLFFERVRLGLADEPDGRATATSTYSFLSTRERYGLVRARESILPVELVLQVSGGDFGLGAFPRIRRPRPTSDAILYE